VDTTSFLMNYRQHEREIEQRLLHRLAARDRSPVTAARGGHRLRMAHLRTQRRTARD